MRALSTIILIAVLSALAELLLPWWIVAVVAFAVSIATALPPGRAFAAGFAGVGLCWLTASVVLDLRNGHILSTKMAELFHLPGYAFFIAVTVLIGGLTGGMAAAAGALINRKR